jgi:hypothetical protein
MDLSFSGEKVKKVGWAERSVPIPPNWDGHGLMAFAHPTVLKVHFSLRQQNLAFTPFSLINRPLCKMPQALISLGFALIL